MHVRCPTTHAVLLLGVKGKAPIYHFAGAQNVPPGLIWTPPSTLPLVDSLLARASSALEAEGHTLEAPVLARSLCLRHDYSDVVTYAGEPATLYLATLDLAGFTPSPGWQVLPEILRSLPRDRGRLAYLRAFQVLSGGLETHTKALEVDDVDKYFN